MNKWIPFAAGTFLIVVSSVTTAEPVTLTGFYKGEFFSMNFDNGKCILTNEQNKEKVETPCSMKNGLLYFKPVVPKGEKMIRDVWLAYKVLDNRIESSHLEDMNDGQIFYKDSKPTIVLFKQ
jgi:hypothetical protein